MKGRLEPEDERRVEAAKGWCALHDFAEAAKELGQVSPTAVEHPSVLEARWQVYANLDRWDEAHAVSTVLTRLAPHEPEGWIYLASNWLCYSWKCNHRRRRKHPYNGSYASISV